MKKFLTYFYNRINEELSKFNGSGDQIGYLGEKGRLFVGIPRRYSGGQGRARGLSKCDAYVEMSNFADTGGENGKILLMSYMVTPFTSVPVTLFF